MLTATPGRMAPLLSTARPVMVPVVDCADGRRRASQEKTAYQTPRIATYQSFGLQIR